MIYFAFLSICTTFELRSKVLTLGKTQINLVFLSLIRTFAAEMKKLYIETYGCQMNVADSEVVASVMQMAGLMHLQLSASAGNKETAPRIL